MMLATITMVEEILEVEMEVLTEETGNSILDQCYKCHLLFKRYSTICFMRFLVIVQNFIRLLY